MTGFILKDFYYITGIGFVIVGRVEGGTINLGMNANISGKNLQIKFIEANHQQLKRAESGKDVGLNIKISGFSKNFFGKLFGWNSEEQDFLRKYIGQRLEFN